MAKKEEKASGEVVERPLRKLTPKQEMFAAYYVETSNACEAYRRAYDTKNTSQKVVENEACILLKHRGVSIRIDELQQELTDSIQLSRSWIIRELIDNAKKAKEAEDFGPSNKALELLGKTDEMKLFVERSESTNVNVDLSDILRARRQEGNRKASDSRLIEG